MTENQLKYLAYQESLRHNSMMESQAASELEERERSNREQEAARYYSIYNDLLRTELETHKLNQDLWLGTTSNVLNALKLSGSLIPRVIG